jgi:hypothetical protein
MKRSMMIVMKTIISDKCRNAYLHKELREHMLTVGDITDEEKNDLYEWVASSNSSYDNPCYYSDDRGNPNYTVDQ